MNEEKALSSETRQRIDIDTYHAFFWRILRTHGYLLGLPRRLEIITPPNEAIALSAIRRDYPSQNKQSELQKQEKKDGRRQNANVSLRTMAECILASSLIMLASYCTVRTRCGAS
jgi:superfamily I DNA/RNA helicase